jgi:hypothetical protein
MPAVAQPAVQVDVEDGSVGRYSGRTSALLARFHF